MIKFFRKIRHGLLSENKISKYALYAIGEIVLVVIGILIALQINQWQNVKQLRETEKKMLFEMEINLTSNLEVMADLIERESDMVENIKYIFDHFQARKSMNDTVRNYLARVGWLEELQLVNSTYETLKSIGLGTISSDSLRVDIAQLFEVDYPKEVNWTNSIANAQLTTLTYPMMLKHYSVEERLIPVNFENLMTDPAYKSMLALELGFKKAIILRAGILYEKTENLRKKVQDEIIKLN